MLVYNNKKFIANNKGEFNNTELNEYLKKYKDKILKLSADFEGALTLNSGNYDSTSPPEVYGIKLESNNNIIKAMTINDMNGNVNNYIIPTK